MKGWVYVITNKAMPSLVKVGFSTKDPELRARELQHTGSPHPYLVEYELLIEEPYQVEQETHRLLSSKHEAKEWFRCTPEEAVAAIKHVAGNRIITETYKRVERARTDALFQQQLQEKEAQRKQKQAEQEIENRTRAEESAIRQKYEKQFEITFPPRPFWNYWIGGSSLSLIGISMMSPKGIEAGTFFLAAIVGAILGTFLQSHFEDRRKQSSTYVSLEKQRDEELALARAGVACDAPAKTAEILSQERLAKFEMWSRSHPRREELARYVQRVEKVVGGLSASVDCREIAFLTKIKMALKHPRKNVINMITNFYPGITDSMASDIFDALDTEPGNVFRDVLEAEKENITGAPENVSQYFCAKCGKLYFRTCPTCGS